MFYITIHVVINLLNLICTNEHYYEGKKKCKMRRQNRNKTFNPLSVCFLSNVQTAGWNTQWCVFVHSKFLYVTIHLRCYILYFLVELDSYYCLCSFVRCFDTPTIGPGNARSTYVDIFVDNTQEKTKQWTTQKTKGVPPNQRPDQSDDKFSWSTNQSISWSEHHWTQFECCCFRRNYATDKYFIFLGWR